MHNVDFKSDNMKVTMFIGHNLKNYIVHPVKYTNLVQSFTWPHFQFIVL